MVVRIAGERMYLWRAVDHEGEVVDMLVQCRRDSRAALRLMRKLLKTLSQPHEELRVLALNVSSIELPSQSETQTWAILTAVSSGTS
jgi:hypothetical protein